MQILRLIVPLSLGALLWAQQPATETPTAEELVARLGHEDYDVREEATRKLIEMGEAAVPALEKAQASDDLEVRLRAGRALRAIRPKVPAGGQPDEPGRAPRGALPGLPGGGYSIEMQSGPDGVTVRLRRTGEDGEPVVEEFRGESVEQLKRDHPELAEALRGLRFEWGARDLPDPRELLERFGFREDGGGDFWKQFEEEWARENERMRRWMQDARQRHQQLFDEWKGGGAFPGAREFGVRASRPDPVLDAQLQLRGRGLVIEGVEKDTRADRLGLQRHDVLVELAGTEIREAGDLARALAARPDDGEWAAVVVRRGARVRLPAGD